MDIFQILTVLTFVSSTATMVLVIMAVLPHVKNGMAVIRDAVLWAAFVMVVAMASWFGWRRLADWRPAPATTRSQRPTLMETSTASGRPPVLFSADTDPYYNDRDH